MEESACLAAVGEELQSVWGELTSKMSRTSSKVQFIRELLD